MLTSIFGKTNAFILKWFGLFGIPFYIFFNKAAVDAKTLNPNADIFDVAGEFYGTVAEATVETFIPGTVIVLTEIFSFFADTLLPGIGTTLSFAFNAVSDSAEVMEFTPDFLPTV